MLTSAWSCACETSTYMVCLTELITVRLVRCDAAEGTICLLCNVMDNQPWCSIVVIEYTA